MKIRFTVSCDAGALGSGLEVEVGVAAIDAVGGEVEVVATRLVLERNAGRSGLNFDKHLYSRCPLLPQLRQAHSFIRRFHSASGTLAFNSSNRIRPISMAFGSTDGIAGAEWTIAC